MHNKALYCAHAACIELETIQRVLVESATILKITSTYRSYRRCSYESESKCSSGSRAESEFVTNSVVAAGVAVACCTSENIRSMRSRMTSRVPCCCLSCVSRISPNAMVSVGMVAVPG
ncbi:hypothetical protein RB195_013898 [Necator americanus]|uniref:Uncharacterized protein n=1 Tax=Necator americanus TaxID=51031 RepID=A0ABR1DXT8_NECAM